MKKNIFFIVLILAIAGVIDAGYLTYEHFANVIPPCTINRFFPFLSDCGTVLRSPYAVMFGIPVALIGLIHYIILSLITVLAIFTNKKIFWFWILFQVVFGAVGSLYFMLVQFFIIKSFCVYCTISALISLSNFIIAVNWLEQERKTIVIYSFATVYRYAVVIFFLVNPEVIHESMINFGEFLGRFNLIKKIINFFLPITNHHLEQIIAGINFKNPIGLAAGFDYNSQLTQILPSLGFGFETVGTITNMPYQGNPRPMLGRLPKSQSLMVNKGFKNIGATKIIQHLNDLQFSLPVGISIGRTNSPKLQTQKQSINDIIEAFRKFESSKINNAYYELNISCPNLIHGGDISFYPPKKLEELLSAVEKLQIKKPVFIKMPIEKSDKEFLSMLKIISQYKFVNGVIIGNLQKNHKDPAFNQTELKKFKKGNFSGKPCEKRSNELIKLTFQKYKKRFVIIGCGGVFSVNDAYKKIKLGASLVQLITGMIYQGPQLIAQINLEFLNLLKKDGFKHVSEAVGVDNS